MSKQTTIPEGIIPLDLVIYNPKNKSKHTAPCMIPMDILDMTMEQMKQSYGDHLVSALFELVQHQSFRRNLAAPKLVIAE